TADGFDSLASITSTDDRDSAAPVEGAVALARRALAAAELAGAAITTTVLHAPTTHMQALAAGLREVGITAPTRTAADTDAIRGALELSARRPATSGRLRQARHAVAAAVPLAGAAALLWLLQRTAVSPRSPLAEYLTTIPGSHLLTLWPAWSMVGVLVCLGAVAVVLRSADQQLRHSTQDTEAQRRGTLARGLHLAAGACVSAGVVTAMLGATAYPTLPTGALLIWAVGPAALLAATLIVIARLIRDGHTSALRWQIWLRVPNTTAVLATVGLLLVHADLQLRMHWPGLVGNLPAGAIHRLPTGLDRLGAVTVALAILPLLVHRTGQQILLSPLVVSVVLLTHSYTNTNVVIVAMLTAVTGWWLSRLRPAAAYSNPRHPASTAAAELEPARTASA
ncbi:MAG TPA: hypothetical protein VJY85_09765, partial [Candidatus Limnocylindria bacterium]|nr:hypothetical protein [Candidatus Limnocylindria bacterium]